MTEILKNLSRSIPTLQHSVLLMFAIIFIAFPSFSQKRKKSKNKTAVSQFTLSAEKQAELEYYFVEGEKYFMVDDSQRAFENFQKVLSIDPNNAAANFKSAHILNLNKEFTKALSFAIKAKDQGTKNKYYYLLLAEVYTNLAQLDNAILTYQELLKNVSGSDEYLFEMAGLQFYQKQYDQALESYEKAKQRFGIMEEITFKKQQIYLKQNKLDEVISEGQELMDTNPSKPLYTLSLAQILIANDRLGEGKEILEKYNEAYGPNDQVSILLAELYRKSGATFKALEALKPVFRSTTTDPTAKIRTLAGYMSLLPNENLESGVIELAEILTETHPDSFQSYALAGDLYFNLGQKLKAKEYYVKSIELDNSNFNIWQNILSLEMELTHYDDAIIHANQALEVFPNQAALYYFGGTAYLIQKKYKEAVKIFNTGKSYANSDANLKSIFLGQLGDAYNGIGNHEKSDNSYDEALKAKPDNDHVLNNYSYFLSIRKKNLKKALDMSSQLVEKYPGNSTYLDTHAWVLYMLRDFGEAKKHLEKALEDVPSSTIFEHYGDVLFQLGNVDLAIIQWEKAKEGTDDMENLNKKIANKQVYE